VSGLIGDDGHGAASKRHSARCRSSGPVSRRRATFYLDNNVSVSTASVRLNVVAQETSTTSEALRTPEQGPNWLQLLLCKKCFEKCAGSAVSDSIPDAQTPAPDPGGVAALLAIATDAVADERDRGRALDSKTVSLAGFTGLILSVNGLLAGPIFKQKLGSVGRPLAQVFFFLAMSCLLLAILLAVVGVLMPQKYRGMGRDQLRDFTSPTVQANDATWVHRSMLGALAVIIGQDRPINDCKARLIKGVAFFMALAFVLVAGEAATLGLQHVGI
jgi:hypothetical protein